MKKYYSRQTAPLKFHKIVPGFCFIKLLFSILILVVLLVNIQNIKNTINLLAAVYRIINIPLMIGCVVGLSSFKKYAWYFIIFTSALNIVYYPVEYWFFLSNSSYFINNPHIYENSEIAMELYSIGRFNTLSSEVSKILTIFGICTLIYYIKRKPLFFMEDSEEIYGAPDSRRDKRDEPVIYSAPANRSSGAETSGAVSDSCRLPTDTVALFDEYYPKALTQLRRAAFEHDAAFELLPLMYVYSSLDELRATFIAANGKNPLFAYIENNHLTSPELKRKFNERLDFYSSILSRGKLRGEGVINTAYWNTPALRIAAAFADIVYNPKCADDYLCAPYYATDPLIQQDFAENVMPATARILNDFRIACLSPQIKKNASVKNNEKTASAPAATPAAAPAVKTEQGNNATAEAEKPHSAGIPGLGFMRVIQFLYLPLCIFVSFGIVLYCHNTYVTVTDAIQAEMIFRMIVMILCSLCFIGFFDKRPYSFVTLTAMLGMRSLYMIAQSVRFTAMRHPDAVTAWIITLGFIAVSAAIMDYFVKRITLFFPALKTKTRA